MKTVLTFICAALALTSFGQRDIYGKWVTYPDTVVVLGSSCYYASYVVNITVDANGDPIIIELCNTTGWQIQWYHEPIGIWYALGFNAPREKIALFVSPDINNADRITAIYNANALSVGLANLNSTYDPIPSDALSVYTIELRFY